MSAFEDQMKQIAASMSSEAKSVVRQVLQSEHKFRFTNRDELPENFATWALREAKGDEEEL